MKKLIALVLVLVFVPVLSFADPGVVLCYRLNHYAAAYNEDHPGYFDYDTMIIDVYLMDDFSTAYYSKTYFRNGKIETTGFIPCTVSSKKTEDGKRALLFPNGEIMYFYYEDGEFWLQMENGAYHMLECEYFNLPEDLKT